MKLNAVWHTSHPMPKNPPLSVRIAWHTEHIKQCGCRDVPQSLKQYIQTK